MCVADPATICNNYHCTHDVIFIHGDSPKDFHFNRHSATRGDGNWIVFVLQKKDNLI